MPQLYYNDTPLSQMPSSYPASRVTHESVSVTADGVKTYRQLLNELFALVDFDKITLRSMLFIGRNPFYCIEIRSETEIIYTLFDYDSSTNQPKGLKVKVNSSASIYHAQNDGDYSGSVVSSGRTITIFY